MTFKQLAVVMRRRRRAAADAREALEKGNLRMEEVMEAAADSRRRLLVAEAAGLEEVVTQWEEVLEGEFGEDEAVELERCKTVLLEEAVAKADAEVAAVVKAVVMKVLRKVGWDGGGGGGDGGDQ